MADTYVVTDNWRVIVSRAYSRDVVETFREIVRFKIGEGGFDAGPPKTPKYPPSSARNDLESEGEPLAGGGTCQFTNGSGTVSGTGTSFLADVSPGEWIKPGPTPHANAYSAGTPASEEDGWGQVLNVVNDTTITLSSPYVGATHLFAEARPCHKADEPLFTFRKTLIAGDVTWDLADGTDISMVVALGEANADQLGLSPEFFEVGAFDSDGVMLVYGTLNERLKTALVTINLAPNVQF